MQAGRFCHQQRAQPFAATAGIGHGIGNDAIILANLAVKPGLHQRRHLGHTRLLHGLQPLDRG